VAVVLHIGCQPAEQIRQHDPFVVFVGRGGDSSERLRSDCLGEGGDCGLKVRQADGGLW
jgi:hypothetical protein